MGRLKRIVENALIISLVLLIVGNLSSYSETLFNLVQYRNYVIISESMEPSLSVGDLIVTTKTSADDLEVGDVITFNREGMIATHRVIELNEETLTTQGDANNIHDNPIQYEDVIGKYQFKIPMIGHIIHFTTTLGGMILVLTSFLLFVIYEFMIKETPNTKLKESKS